MSQKATALHANLSKSASGVSEDNSSDNYLSDIVSEDNGRGISLSQAYDE